MIIPYGSRGPGLPRNRRVKGFVQSCDVAPTVVDVARHRRASPPCRAIRSCRSQGDVEGP